MATLHGAEPTAELWLASRPNAGRRVLDAVDALLRADGAAADGLERVIVGVGPGGFTGLRIGIATALGLAQSRSIPCVGASSLQALALSIAESAPRADLFVPVLDARRGEVFTAAYRADAGGLVEALAPAALTPSALEAELARLRAAAVVVGGAGVGALGEALPAAARVLAEGPMSSPRAANLARLVDGGAALPVVPVYARLPDAERNLRVTSGP